MSQVRLIDAEGKQMGLMITSEALKLAREAGMDLVEVAPDSSPPVCKIMDFGKYKYDQKKKAHQAKAKQKIVHVKELRLRPKTEEHDLLVKIKKARAFLENGDRVQINMLFRGREMAHIELARGLLERFANEVGDLGKVDQSASLEGRRMTMVLAPLK